MKKYKLVFFCISLITIPVLAQKSRTEQRLDDLEKRIVRLEKRATVIEKRLTALEQESAGAGAMLGSMTLTEAEEAIEAEEERRKKEQEEAERRVAVAKEKALRRWLLQEGIFE